MRLKMQDFPDNKEKKKYHSRCKKYRFKNIQISFEMLYEAVSHPRRN